MTTINVSPSATDGRSLRKRNNQKRYNDDNPQLIAALKAIEQQRREPNMSADWNAAVAAGIPPNALADFEKGCLALPERLRRQVARVCAIRNHMLARQARAPGKYLAFTDAIRFREIT